MRVRAHKSVICLFFVSSLCFINSYAVKSQNINVIDKSKLLKSTNEYTELNEMYDIVNGSLLKKVNLEREHFEKRLDEIQKIPMCYSPITLKEYENELKSLESNLLNHEKLLTDTLPLLKSDLIAVLEFRIKKAVANYSKENGIQLIIDQAELAYYEGTRDITKKIIKHYQTNYSNQEELEKWKHIMIELKEKYKIEQRLMNH